MPKQKLSWKEPRAYKLALLGPPLFRWWGRLLIFIGLGLAILAVPVFVHKQPKAGSWTITVVGIFGLSAMVVYLLPLVEKLSRRRVYADEKGLTLQWIQFFNPMTSFILWSDVAGFTIQQEIVDHQTFDVLVLDLLPEGRLEVALDRYPTASNVESWLTKHGIMRLAAEESDHSQSSPTPDDQTPDWHEPRG